MSLRPQLAWHFDVKGEKQFLYYAERPRGDFKEGEKSPEWVPIHVEMPTRIMEKTEEWMKSKEPISISLELKDQVRNKVVDSWSLIGAKVDQHYIRMSRLMRSHVRFAVVSYKEAKHDI
jgi:hypothetical protein